MVYGVANKMIKFLLFATNLLIFTFGILIFGLSLWANLDEKMLSHLNDVFQQAHIDNSWLNYIEQVGVTAKLRLCVSTHFLQFSV